MSYRKISLVAIIIFLLVSILVGIYFNNNRTNPFNATVNNIFERYPQIRWEIRGMLVLIESPFSFTAAFFFKDSLPQYELMIEPRDLAFLNANLPAPYKDEPLTDQYKISVPAIFIANGENFNAKVRYRGDNYNHWAFEKKSWRVELLDGYVSNMNVFNFIIPEDRAFVQELFSFRLAERLDLITPRAFNATLRINGGGKKLYLLAQHWSDATKVLNGLPPEGLLIGESGKAPLYESIFSIKVYSKKSSDYSDLSSVKKLFELLLYEDDIFYTELPKIVDLDKTLRWIAHSTALFSRSQKGTHNFVAYIDPDSRKIQFIPWNVTMFDGDPKNVPIDVDYNPLVTRILKNPKWKEIRDKYVLQLIGNKNQLTKDFSWMQKIKTDTRLAVLKDNTRLFLYPEYELKINKFMNRYAQGHTKPSNNLQ